MVIHLSPLGANLFKGYVDDLYNLRTSYDKTQPLNYIIVFTVDLEWLI
jgi:vacuolar-type H+-ATPase subunit C/Vma6